MDAPGVKELFLGIVEDAKKRFGFSVTNFCIMGNHIHFILQPENDDLSRIMQWLLSVFAIRYNRLRGCHGHVWYDRFRSKIIADFRQYVATFRYIMENPVRANMVCHPLQYPYNGITYLNRGDSRIIDPILSFARLVANDIAWYTLIPKI